MMWDVDEAIDRLEDFAGQLRSLFDEASSDGDLVRAARRFERWTERLVTWLANNLRSDEADRFAEECELPDGEPDWADFQAGVEIKGEG